MMLRYGLTLTVFLLASLSASAAPAKQWIVVTAPAFRKAIEPLCEQRKAQGLRVLVVPTTDLLSADEIRAGDGRKLREHINKLCREYKGSSFVLLVGAIEGGRLPEPETRVLPALSGTIGRMKGQPSDNGYGCVDDSRTPTVPVGRFPARTERRCTICVRSGTVAPSSTRRAGPNMWWWWAIPVLLLITLFLALYLVRVSPGLLPGHCGEQILERRLEMRLVMNDEAVLADQPDLGTKWSPRYVRVTDALPVTETQKVLKRLLRR